VGRSKIELSEQASLPAETAEIDGYATDIDAEEIGGGEKGPKAAEASAEHDHRHRPTSYEKQERKAGTAQSWRGPNQPAATFVGSP
jgi:hypothetical protein